MAERVDHPTKPGVIDGKAAAPAQHHGLAAGTETVGCRERQGLRQTTAEAHDFREDIASATGGQGNAVAHRCNPGQAGNLDREAADTDQHPFHAGRIELAQTRTAGLEFILESRSMH